MRAGTGAAIAVLCGVQFVDVMGVTSAITALPAMLAGVAAPPGSGPILASAYATFFGGLLLLGAQLGDRYGHRRVLVAGTIAFALVGVVGATAHEVVQLVGARALQGATAAVSVPCALTLLLETADRAGRRAGALAAWSASGAAAGATGLLLGGVLTQQLGWPSVFWLNVPVGLALGLAIVLVVPRRLRTDAALGELNWLASGLAVVGVVLVILGASLAESPEIWLLATSVLVGGLAFLAVLVVRERRAAQPMLPSAALRSANLRTGSLVSFVNTATTSSAAVLASLFLQQELRLNAATAGVSLLPMSLGAICGAAASRPLARRLHARPLAGLGLVGIGLGVAVLALRPGSSGVLAGAGLLRGIELGVSSVAGNDLGTDVPTEVRGVATGIVNTAAQLGTALGIALLMVLATVVGGGRTGTVVSWLTAAVLAMATAVAIQWERDGGAGPGGKQTQARA